MSEELEDLSKFKDQTVEYELPLGGLLERAVGVFKVDGNFKHGTQSLRIHRNYETSVIGEFELVDIPVHRSATPMIQPHHDPSVALFWLSI